MNTRCRRCREEAVTLIEVLVLVAVMGLTAGILLPAFATTKNRGDHGRIGCVNNLKNVGLAYRIFSTDNGGQYPWFVSTNQGGSAEIPRDAANVWRQFATISNELSTPKIVSCPADPERRVAPNFNSFDNTNLSYFIGFPADENPRSIMAGDRNLTTNGVAVGPGLLHIGTNQNAGFSKKIHNNAGNVLLADGSVQQVTSGRFQETVVNAAMASTNAINPLLIP